jgi:hypothetical protein
MATGDQHDLVHRLGRWLPTRWFPSGPDTLIRAVLSGFAAAITRSYAAIAYAALQMRIATATDGFLDLISGDYFGARLPRRPGEADPAFSFRIRREILRERVTREAIDRIVFDATGNHPLIVEPDRPADIGGYRQGFAYGTGAYGSFGRPYEVFVTVPLANPNPFPIIAGWRAGYGGYRGDFAAWALPGILPPPNPNAALVDAALGSVRAAGITIWRRYL